MPPRERGREHVLVSRQPIVDGSDQVVGYRIGYATPGQPEPNLPSPSRAIEVLDQVLAVIDSEEYALGTRAFLPVSRQMLLHHGDIPPVDRERVVLCVRHADMLDTTVLNVVAAARRRGYSFELGGLSRPDFDLSLLRHFDIVELAPSNLGDGVLTSLMSTLRLRGTPALASGVASHAQRDQARALGFRWFAGRFYMTPNLLGGQPVPIGSMQTLMKLARLGTDDLELPELIELIERDVGLGVRLLRYVNSNVYGLRVEVRSVRHAARMLGAKGLSRWALVAASVGSGPGIPREQALLALSRARTCELLADHRAWPLDGDLLFTVGLLSAADVIFSMPMGEIVEELSLAGPTGEALLHHGGPAGEILQAVLAYEHGEFDALSGEESLPALSGAYPEGLRWAREALAATPGD